LNPVVVPILSAYVGVGQGDEFWRAVSVLFNLLAVILGTVTLGGILAAPQLLALLAPGFDPATAKIAAQALRLALPMAFFAGLAAFLAAALNSLGAFSVAALNTVVISAVVVITTLMARAWGIT